MRRRPAALLALLAAAAAENTLLSAGEKPSLKIRGVNLGGWLVLEKWIKPSLFSEWDAFDKKAPKDQWTYCETLGKTECKKRLEQHWDTWVTFDHLKTLASVGVNWLRVPVGYWIVDVQPDEPFADPINGEPTALSSPRVLFLTLPDFSCRRNVVPEAPAGMGRAARHECQY